MTDEHVAAEEKRIDDRRKLSRIGEAIAYRRLPAEYSHANFQTARLPAAVQPLYAATAKTLMGILENPAIYVLLGPRGTGKTWMSAALINEYCRRGRFARYSKCIQMLGDIRSTWRADSPKTENQVIEEYTAPSLLVIDEINERRFTDDESLWITHICDRRHAEGRATVLISNQTQEDFHATIGESILSRISKHGGVIDCDWMDLRPLM
jgi:DNA replication protein DnaC